MKQFSFGILFYLFIFSAIGQGRVVLHLPDIKQDTRFITKRDIVTLAILLPTSFIDGAVERFDFQNRKYFEVKYGASETGFFGSKSYQRLYDSPNFYNKNFGVFDFYHVADDIRKLGYLTSGATFALSLKYRRSNKEAIIKGILFFAASSLSKRVGDSVFDLTR